MRNSAHSMGAIRCPRISRPSESEFARNQKPAEATLASVFFVLVRRSARHRNGDCAGEVPSVRETMRFIELMGLYCNQRDLTFRGCYLPDIFPLSVRIMTGLQCCSCATATTETKRIAFLGKPDSQNPLSRDSHLNHIRDDTHFNPLKSRLRGTWNWGNRHGRPRPPRAFAQ